MPRGERVGYMDRIIIRDLRANAVIGTLEHEKLRPQELRITLVIELDLHPAGETDDLRRSVDYAEIERRALEIVHTSRFALLEALAAELGKMLLAYAPVWRAEVRIVKPSALRRSQAEIEMSFDRKDRADDR